MITSYTQLLKQIATLQSQADQLKHAESAAAAARIRAAIQAHGLTEKDLFATKSGRPAKPTKIEKGAKKKIATSSEPKFADGKGGFWVGRGKRPQWLSAALAAGAKLEDFLAGKIAAATSAVTPDIPEAPVAPSAPEATPVTDAAPAPAAAPAKRKVAARKKPAAKRIAAAKAE